MVLVGLSAGTSHLDNRFAVRGFIVGTNKIMYFSTSFNALISCAKLNSMRCLI